jgi:hypothetical protein
VTFGVPFTISGSATVDGFNTTNIDFPGGITEFDGMWSVVIETSDTNLEYTTGSGRPYPGTGIDATFITVPEPSFRWAVTIVLAALFWIVHGKRTMLSLTRVRAHVRWQRNPCSSFSITTLALRAMVSVSRLVEGDGIGVYKSVRFGRRRTA